MSSISPWAWKGDGVLLVRLYLIDSSTIEIFPKEVNEQLRIEVDGGILRILKKSSPPYTNWCNVFVCLLDKILFFECKRKDVEEVVIKYNKSHF